MLARIGSHLEESFLSILLVLMTLLVFMEVVLRFMFNAGIAWAQEVTLHMSAWFVLFGASYGVKMGSHIGVDALVRLLPHNAKRGASYLAIVLCLAYCGLFLYGGGVYINEVWKRGTPMEDTRFGTNLSAWMVETIGVDGAWNAMRIDLEDFADESSAVRDDIADVKQRLKEAASSEEKKELKGELADLRHELSEVESPGLPLWFAHGPIVIGFLLLVFRFLQVMYRLAIGEIDTMQMADEAKEVLEEVEHKQQAGHGSDKTGGAPK